MLETGGVRDGKEGAEGSGWAAIDEPPSPICPLPLAPQHISIPLLLEMQVWLPPSATAFTPEAIVLIGVSTVTERSARGSWA
jgi:hypothetical protein